MYIQLRIDVDIKLIMIGHYVMTQLATKFISAQKSDAPFINRYGDDKYD